MRNVEERMAMVTNRIRALERRRERRETAGLSALSVFLVLALVTLLGQLGGGGTGTFPEGMAASSLLAESAGGYVLTAVLAFMAGVTVTVLLKRKQERKPMEEENR